MSSSNVDDKLPWLHLEVQIGWVGLQGKDLVPR